MLTPKCRNAIFCKIKQFRAIDDYRKLCNWAFQITHYWIPKIQDGSNPPSWKLTWRHFFCRSWSGLDKISETGAEWHVDCGNVVEIETRCRCGGCLGKFNGMSSQSHLPHCRVLSPGKFNVMIPELRVTL